MTWFKKWFDREEYELVYPHRDLEEAEEVVDLIEGITRPDSAAHILDVACGRGRHSRVLASRGYQVTGIDLSKQAIAQARKRAEKEGLSVTFEVGDMREPYCTGCADGVVNLFSSFGYFENESDHERAIGAMADALRSGGWLVQDFMNATAVARNLVPDDYHTRGGVEIHQRRWIERGRINKTITIAREGRQQSFTESVRLLHLDDFQRLYEQTGLNLVDTYGDYAGSPHTTRSPRLILHAQKK